MRLALTLGFLLLAGAASAETLPGVITPAGAILLHAHPRPWRPASWFGAGRVAMTLPADDGTLPDAPLGTSAARGPMLNYAQRADGSGHATLGGSIRAFEVVRLADDGTLIPSCLHSAKAADTAVHGASAPKER